MRKWDMLKSQWKAEAKSGGALEFENCKGGYFSTTDDYGLKVVGKTAQNGTPAPDTPQEIQCVKKGTKIRCCGKNLALFNEMELNGNAIEKVLYDGDLITAAFTCKINAESMSQGSSTLLYYIKPDGTTKYVGGESFIDSDSQFTETFSKIVILNWSRISGKIYDIRIDVGNEITTPCDLYEDDIWYPASGKVIRKHFAEDVNDSTKIYHINETGYPAWQRENATSVYMLGCMKYNGELDYCYSDYFKSGGWQWGLLPEPYNYILCGNNSNVLYIIIENRFLGGITDDSTAQEKFNAIKQYIDNNPFKIVYKLTKPLTEYYEPQPIYAPQGEVNIIQKPQDLNAKLEATMLVRR